MGLLLSAAAPDLGHEAAPPATAHDLRRGVAPPGHCPNPMELTGLTIYPSFPGGLDGKESAFNVGDQI